MSAALSDPRSYAKYIDHSLLNPSATEWQLEEDCTMADKYGFRGVCVNSGLIHALVTRLEGTGIIPISTVGYPLGNPLPAVVAMEAALAAGLGAQEITMMLPPSLACADRWSEVEDYLRDVVSAARDAKVTVIIDPALLVTSDRLKQTCECVHRAGGTSIAAFARFDGGGATLTELRLIGAYLDGTGVSVKAFGATGPRNIQALKSLLEAGVTRIGTKNGARLMTEVGETEAPMHGN